MDSLCLCALCVPVCLGRRRSTRRLRSAGIGRWSRSPALDVSQQDAQRRKGHGVAGPLSVNSLCLYALCASVCLGRRRSTRRLRSAGIGRWSRSPALDLSHQDTQRRRGHGVAGPLSVNSLCRCALRASVCLVRRRSTRRLRSAGISRWSRSPALDLSQQDTRWRRGHGAAEFGFSVGSVWPRERHRVVWIRTGFV